MAQSAVLFQLCLPTLSMELTEPWLADPHHPDTGELESTTLATLAAVRVLCRRGNEILAPHLKACYAKVVEDMRHIHTEYGQRIQAPTNRARQSVDGA